MGEPLFLLQIVDAEDGTVIRLPAGGTLELNLVTALATAFITRSVRLDRDVIASAQSAIVKRGVGLFRTEAHVRTAIEEGMREVLGLVQAGAVPIEEKAAIEASVRDVLSVLKKQTRGAV